MSRTVATAILRHPVAYANLSLTKIPFHWSGSFPPTASHHPRPVSLPGCSHWTAKQCYRRYATNTASPEAEEASEPEATVANQTDAVGASRVHKDELFDFMKDDDMEDDWNHDSSSLTGDIDRPASSPSTVSFVKFS